MKETAVGTKAQYAVYECTNSTCTEGEFASTVPPVYIELPGCPHCGCPSILVEVLRRDG